MAKSLNLCQFIGYLGRAPETAYTQSGTAVAKFSVAVADDYKNQQGNKVERTNWVNCVAFQRLAEIIGEFCDKGSRVYVSGKFTVRKWQDQSGADRYTTEIVVGDLQMLDSKPSGDSEQHQGQYYRQPTQQTHQHQSHPQDSSARRPPPPRSAPQQGQQQPPHYDAPPPGYDYEDIPY